MFNPDLLAPYCERKTFRAGDVLRHRDRYYRDLFLLSGGIAEVRLAVGGQRIQSLERGVGSPIGEIGFLSGRPATADVVALTDVNAFAIGDADLYAIEKADPELAVSLLRFLGEKLEERTAENQQLFSISGPSLRGPEYETLLCGSDKLLEEAAKLRYRAYCEELGRDSPYADHTRKTITDSLDEFGHTFIVRRDGQTVGTLRGNRPTEGPLGMFEELYGMAESPFHPAESCVCTKFIVARGERGGSVAMELLGTICRYSRDKNISVAFIDCIPALLHYYRSLGFRPVGKKFMHYENGPSFPMMIDMVRHGPRLGGKQGPLQMAQIFVKAKGFKLLHSVKGHR